ncbi:MAG: hypothetical protein ABW217_15240 [Polyangiaceae bacterium]
MTASGYVLQGRPGFSFARPGGSQRADLRDVTGTLALSPPDSPPIKLALFMIDLYFEPEQTEGEMRPFLQLSARPGMGEDYVPLYASWPDVERPLDEPAQASPLEP